MSELKLLNCPFCGGEAEIGNPYPKTFLIWCRNCRIGTTNCPSRKRAFEKWNRRQPMANIVEKLEENSQYCVPLGGQSFTGIKLETAINIVKQEINKEN